MNNGTIQLLIGPMFSGKSELLIKNIEEKQKASLSVIAIRFKHDSRYSDEHIASHSGDTFPAQSASNSAHIKEILEHHHQTQVVGIDEVQFFDEGIIPIFEDLKNKGMIILTAGLDYDYQGNTWETTEELKKIADRVEHLFAVCTICHKKIATRTTRVSNSSERIVIGGEELYEPRCEEHFEIGN